MNKVLIIDDDILFCQLLEMVFSKRGWMTASAQNTSQGWNLVKDFKPDLVVLDISLQEESDGIKLLKKISSENTSGEIKVVMTTASDYNRWLNECLESGAQMLVPKPFSPKAFVNQVERLFH